MNDIEPRILPLVDALNATRIVQTFSSCEGHFYPEEQTIVDRNRAEVRFVPARGTTVKQVENLLTYVLTRFKTKHGLIPVQLGAYKQYTPIDDNSVEETFVLDLRPFNRFDPPDRKRSDTNRAIEQVVRVINAFGSTV